jgi:hypothetical protein
MLRIVGVFAFRAYRAVCAIVSKSFSTRFSEGIIMTVVDRAVLTAQEVAEQIVVRAECEGKKFSPGDRFEVVDSSKLSCSSEMSTLLRCATLNLAYSVKHDSSCVGTHYFEKIR